MEIKTRKTIFEGEFIRVVRKVFLTKSGKNGAWEVVERKNCHKRIVIIFALTDNKEVILEKSYRVPLESFVLELPAGITDKEGESEEDAARRELLEETGFWAGKIIPVFTSVAAPGLTNSEYAYFFAPGVKLVGKSSGDDSEEIDVLTVPLENLVDFVLNAPLDLKIDDKILNLLPVLQKKKLI